MKRVFSISIIAITTTLASACKWLAPAREESSTKIVRGIDLGNLDAESQFTVAIALGQSSLLCSGVVLTPRTIISAGHCFAQAPAAADLVVIFGVDAGNGKRHRVASYRLHPDFVQTASGIANDLALLVLADALPPEALSATILSDEVALPMYPQRVWIAGYGITGTGVASAGHLRATYTYFSSEDATTKEIVLSSAGAQNNVCDGDSGGPAYLGSYEVFAVSSRVKGSKCEVGRAVFTDLRKHRAWIDEHKVP